MADSVTVSEHTHKFWKTTSIFSGIISIICFVIFWNLTDPFWAGASRFIAFIFFAAAVMAYLKIMDGPLEVTLTSSEELLEVTYTKKERAIQEEEFDRNSIKKIELRQPQGNIISSLLQPSSQAFRITFSDTDQKLYLFEFRGRPLLFDLDSQQKVRNYLKDVGIVVS